MTREPRFLLLVPVVGVVSVGGLFPFLFVCGFPYECFVGLEGFRVPEKQGGPCDFCRPAAC